MKVNFFFSFLLLLVYSFNASSQTMYHFEYNFQQPDDSAVYQVFFVGYDDGSGSARIKYQIPGNTDTQWLEMHLQGRYVAEKPGIADTNKLVYTTSDAHFIKGNSKAKFTPPVFWFVKNPIMGIYEPTVVSDTLNNMAVLIKAEYVQKDDLKQDFVLQFFAEEDAIYKNLFGPRSRGLSEAEKTVKIHLLVVANTNDSAIGASCYKDMTRMVHTFQDLAEFLDIKIYPTTIFGKTYTKKNIEKAIKDLAPGPNDVVIFYYSGHGFRKVDRPKPAKPYSRYPFLDFRAKPTDDYNVYSMNMQDIFETIRKKGARLNLVLSDCCNYLPQSTNSIGEPMPKPRGSGLEWVEDNCKTLFLNPDRQSVLATAADVGQFASSNNDFGGFFSYFFKTSMETHFSTLKTNVTWDQVLQEAAKQTDIKAHYTYCSKPYIPANICKQNPFYNKPVISGTGN